MTVSEQRSLEDGRAWLRQRLERGVHPLDLLDQEAAWEAVESLQGLDPESWAASWGAAADRFAGEAARTSDPGAKREAWLQAYRFSFVGRYPIPNDPAKERQYARAREFFRNATSLDDLATPPSSGGTSFITPDLSANGTVKAGYTVLVVPGTGASQVLAGAATCNGTTSQSSYHATATPATLGQTGTRAFATNNSGSVYQNYTGVAIPASLAGAQVLQ